jgi:hypothetical protein
MMRMKLMMFFADFMMRAMTGDTLTDMMSRGGDADVVGGVGGGSDWVMVWYSWYWAVVF